MEKGNLIVNSGGYRVLVIPCRLEESADIDRLNSYMVLGVTIKRKLEVVFDGRDKADEQSIRNHLRPTNYAIYSMSSQVEHQINRAKYLNHWSKKN
jgi:hypothetical protein